MSDVQRSASRPSQHLPSADGGRRPAPQLLHVEPAGRPLALEYAWVGEAAGEAPVVVFLHEGLGSVSTWKDYPARLCQAGGYRGLVFSRPGYGKSTPRAPGERWPLDYLNAQARDVLPAVFASLGVGARGERPWLFGHSDGGSIALIYAALFSEALAGAVVIAPHVSVEDKCLAGLERARKAYLEGDLRAKLGRHHDDVDSAFWGWNDAWLDPAFRRWNIEALLPMVRRPVLAVQGEDDEYGTMAQIESVGRRAPRAELLKLPRCGHWPHRDRPETLTYAAVEFIARHAGR